MKAGWPTKPLGDGCNVIGGGAPSKDKAHSSIYSGDIRWATVRNIKSDLISDTAFKHTPATSDRPANMIPVIPAQAGIQDTGPQLDSRLRGNDDEEVLL